MKKVNKLLHLVLGFSAGVLAGAFIRLGFEIIDGRPAAIGGEALIVSQFTLLANCRHGNRPDFLASAKPGEAKRLYEYFTAQVKKTVSHVDSGVFGAHMEVSLLNNGPVTILLDTEELKKK